MNKHSPTHGVGMPLMIFFAPMRKILLLQRKNTLLGALPGLLFAFTGFGQALPARVAGIEIQEVSIPMHDGTELAADLYLPADARESDRFPVVLEYLPYRKDEGRSHRFPFYSYFVKHGYIVARVDIRGTGRSRGKLVDGEYSEQEQQDGEQVIDWLSRQPFSTGKVAMLGISWGGFNALHLAMRRPPALKTVISLMSTDDIYEDDVHFMDGIMHIDAYEIGQDLANALPGAPDFVIDEEYFRNRFDTEPWLLKYKRQQTDGPFWDRASLNTDYGRIDIPLFVVGGWYDGYRDFVPRIVQHADVPVKALLGPWNHTWPNRAEPGPAIEWREMAVRWLDHWLKGIDTGLMEEPAVVYYQRDWHAPGGDLPEIPGSWKTAATWPASRDTLLYLQPDHQLGARPESLRHTLLYKPTVGVEASGSVMWWGDWAPDQRAADVYSLTYDSEPLSDSLEVLGFPQVLLQTSATAPAANWIVRLSDVAPDGRVTQVTGAGFNATHRNSSVKPEPLVPDSVYALPIELHATSWTFRKGHRIRLSVGNAQWPMFWPSPHPMTTALHSGGQAPSLLRLPVPSGLASRPLTTPFPRPAEDPRWPGYESLESETLSGFAEIREITRNERTRTTTVLATNSGSDRYPWGTVRYTEAITHQVGDDTPAEARVQSTYTTTVELPGRTLTWTGILDFSSDLHHYYYRYTRKLEENGRQVREKQWEETLARE